VGLTLNIEQAVRLIRLLANALSEMKPLKDSGNHMM